MSRIYVYLDKPQLEMIVSELPNYARGNWTYTGNRLSFEYYGEPQASLVIPYNNDSWRKGYIEFGGITTVRALTKEYLTKDEMDMIVMGFYENILKRYCDEHPGIRIVFDK